MPMNAANSKGGKKLRVLTCAFVCSPSGNTQLGSGEAVLGWNLVTQLARFHEVHVLTHPSNREGIEKGLELIRSHGAAYCFLDTASGRIDVAKELFKLADFVIFPVQPSEDDLTAAPVTVQALRKAGVPFVFVLTRVKPGTLITAQAAAVLSKHGEVAETFVNDRTGYKSPYPKGQTVTEAEPRGPAAREIAALWVNIKSCLHDSMQGTQTKEVRAHG